MIALLKSWLGYSKKTVEVIKPPKAEPPRVGEYYADYTPLTEQEMATTDKACDELFARSKPVSR